MNEWIDGGMTFVFQKRNEYIVNTIKERGIKENENTTYKFLSILFKTR